MDTISKLLNEIGLSDKESTMYVALLRSGTQATSVLAKRAAMNRGTAYVILHSLLAKGLVTQTVRRKIQYFSPLKPAQLLAYIDHRQQELKRQREKVQAMMGQLIAITNPLSATPKIQFFEGAEGARAVLEDTLSSNDKTLRAFLSIADVSAFIGADFFFDYTKRRIAADYTLHAIRTQEKDKQAFKSDQYARQYITSRKQKRVVRHVPEDLAFPISIYIYDHKLGILSSKDEGFALLIESRELAEMLGKLFDLLWKSGTK